MLAIFITVFCWMRKDLYFCGVVLQKRMIIKTLWSNSDFANM